jgi:hypothetical protein
VVKYGCEKVLRFLSGTDPKLVYPFFDAFVGLLDCDNNFLRWGGIITVSHLAAADSKGKFEKIFPKYYSFIKGPVMVSAANVIAGSPRIAAAKPDLTERIVKEILKVERAEYQMHGKPSTECGNIARGHAAVALGAMYPRVENKGPVMAFIKRQRENPRANVRKDVEKLLKELG